MDQTSTHIMEDKGVEKVEEGGVLSWSAMYRMLLVYGEKHGTHDVPPSVVVSLSNGSYFKLGEWLEVQREEYKFQRLSSSKASMVTINALPFTLTPAFNKELIVPLASSIS